MQFYITVGRHPSVYYEYKESGISVEYDIGELLSVPEKIIKRKNLLINRPALYDHALQNKNCNLQIVLNVFDFYDSSSKLPINENEIKDLYDAVCTDFFKTDTNKLKEKFTEAINSGIDYKSLIANIKN